MQCRRPAPATRWDSHVPDAQNCVALRGQWSDRLKHQLNVQYKRQPVLDWAVQRPDIVYRMRIPDRKILWKKENKIKEKISNFE